MWSPKASATASRGARSPASWRRSTRVRARSAGRRQRGARGQAAPVHVRRLRRLADEVRDGGVGRPAEVGVGRPRRTRRAGQPRAPGRRERFPAACRDRARVPRSTSGCSASTQPLPAAAELRAPGDVVAGHAGRQRAAGRAPATAAPSKDGVEQRGLPGGPAPEVRALRGRVAAALARARRAGCGPRRGRSPARRVADAGTSGSTAAAGSRRASYDGEPGRRAGAVAGGARPAAGRTRTRSAGPTGHRRRGAAGRRHGSGVGQARQDATGRAVSPSRDPGGRGTAHGAGGSGARRPHASARGGRVEPRGLEPLTPCLQSRCATNCAKAPGERERSGQRVDVVGGLGPEGLLVAALVDLLLGETAPAAASRTRRIFFIVAP